MLVDSYTRAALMVHYVVVMYTSSGRSMFVLHRTRGDAKILFRL